jgi:Smg protein
MFDILVYVFENYLPDACPEPNALARRLSAAGFEDDAIAEAIQWLAGLEQAQEDGGLQRQPQKHAIRLYSEPELDKLPAECRGFLAFLEHEGAIDPTAREMILERAMAVDNAVVHLGKFKVIVLMVMWRRQLSLDNLVFEDLLAEDDEVDLPLMH